MSDAEHRLIEVDSDSSSSEDKKSSSSVSSQEQEDQENTGGEESGESFDSLISGESVDEAFMAEETIFPVFVPTKQSASMADRLQKKGTSALAQKKEEAMPEKNVKYQLRTKVQRIARTELGEIYMQMRINQEELPSVVALQEENANTITTLVNFMEEDSISTPEKLRMIRNDQGYSTLFCAFLDSEYSTPTFLLWHRLEQFRSAYPVLKSESVRRELQLVIDVFLDSESPLEINIGKVTRNAILEVMKTPTSERINIDLLTPLEVELREMLFLKVQNFVIYLEKLDAFSPDFEFRRTRLRGLRTANRKVANILGPGSTSDLVADVNLGFSVVEQAVANSQWALFRVLLQVVSENLDKKRYANFLVMLLSQLQAAAKFTEFFSDLVRWEVENVAGRELIDLPLSSDMLTVLFYDKLTGEGSRSRDFMDYVYRNEDFLEICKISVRHLKLSEQLESANAKKSGAVTAKIQTQRIEALTHCAGIFDRVVDGTELLSPVFVKCLNIANEAFTRRFPESDGTFVVAGYLLVSVLQQSIIAPDMFGFVKRGASEGTQQRPYYYLVTLRDMLLKMVEGGKFAATGEYIEYNNWMDEAQQQWSQLQSYLLNDLLLDIKAEKALMLARLRYQQIRLDPLFAEGERLISKQLHLNTKTVISLLKKEGDSVPAHDAISWLEDPTIQSELNEIKNKKEHVVEQQLNPDVEDAHVNDQLEVIMKQKRREFVTYLEEQLCDESFRFWEDINKMDGCKTTEQRISLLEQVDLAYVSGTAEMQVAFSSPARKAFEAALSAQPLDEATLLETVEVLRVEATKMLQGHVLSFRQHEQERKDASPRPGGKAPVKRTSSNNLSSSPGRGGNDSTLSKLKNKLRFGKRRSISENVDVGEEGQDGAPAKDQSIHNLFQAVMTGRHKAKFTQVLQKQMCAENIELWSAIESVKKAKGKKALSKSKQTYDSFINQSSPTAVYLSLKLSEQIGEALAKDDVPYDLLHKAQTELEMTLHPQITKYCKENPGADGRKKKK